MLTQKQHDIEEIKCDFFELSPSLMFFRGTEVACQDTVVSHSNIAFQMHNSITVH